jgi:L-lactate dehydrogenase complex protein LldG
VIVDDFLAAVSAWGGVARRVPTTGAARGAVAEILADYDARTICHWEGDVLVAALDPATLAAPAPPEHADAGITGAERAVAATGTLVLTYGDGRGRGVGLLPDIHIAVFAADRVVRDLPTALQLAYAGGGPPPAAITLVTGPSASSDIEKIRVTGVHGPRRLGVVVVG